MKKITIDAIHAKSEELGRSPQEVLSLYMLEQLALCIAGSALREKLLLKNYAALSHTKGCLKLSYIYLCGPGEGLTRSDFAMLLRTEVKGEQQSNIRWSFRSHMEGERLVVELSGKLEDEQLPVLLFVDQMKQESLQRQPCVYEHPLLMEPDKKAALIGYPLEEQLLEDLGEALSGLELVADMGVYERMYEALGILPIEGRPFGRALLTYCQTHAITLDKERFRLMEKYMHYPYMKKKWQSYCRRRKQKLPGWEGVYGRVWDFLEPLWSAHLQDMVYLGSWIPELGRYLD